MDINGVYAVSLTHEMFGLPLRRFGKMKLDYNGSFLKGSMFPLFFWLDSPFKGGTVENNAFRFTVSFATPCQQYAMEVEGSVAEDGAVTGVVHSPMGDYTMEGHRV